MKYLLLLLLTSCTKQVITTEKHTVDFREDWAWFWEWQPSAEQVNYLVSYQDWFENGYHNVILHSTTSDHPYDIRRSVWFVTYDDYVDKVFNDDDDLHYVGVIQKPIRQIIKYTFYWRSQDIRQDYTNWSRPYVVSTNPLSVMD